MYAEATSPLTEFHTGYYKGGSKVFKSSSSSSWSSFSFLTRQVLKTDRDGILKIAAELVFKLANDGISIFADSVAFTIIPNDSLRRRRRSWVSFRMEGFWEESSGTVCMVGSTYSRGGEEDLKLKAVLNLENVNPSATITSLFTGTFHVQKKDQDFDISVFMFPNMNYKYSLVPDEMGLARNDLPAGLEPRDGKFCALFETLVYEFSLTYAADCIHPSATDNCSPFETQSLPPTMFFNAIGCSDRGDRKELRVLLQFTNQRADWSYNPNTTMIGEGLWDKNKNQVHIIACRVSMPFSDAVVNDCLVRLQFSFPAMWSIRDRNTLVGKIKKTYPDDDLGSSITARSTNNYISVFPNLNYDYTEAKRVEKFCHEKDKFTDHEKGVVYPNWSSRDLSFEISIQALDGTVIGSGFAYPLFVGKEMYQRSAYDIPLYESIHSTSNSGNNPQFNISYTISMSRLSDAKVISIFNNSLRDQTGISAEGVYNVETGSLCMVGCRSLVGDSWDCEIGITIQFSWNNAGRGLKGSIESTRKISDPLYFESVTIFAATGAPGWVWRMHLELCLVLISNTFSCIFVASLLFHVRKHPQVVSMVMIGILALGHAVPLLLNFESALIQSSRYQVSVFLEAGRWLEVSEVVGRVITVVTLFFELCLLQLSICSATRDMKSWVAEKKSWVFALPLYCVGAFAAPLIFLNRHSSLTGSFLGLVVDGFLFPQILLNISRNSSEKRLLPGLFYIGTTLLRLLPHVYDLWRSVFGHMEGSYLYAVPDTDFYSTAWDVIIVLGGLLLALIVYLQQRFGGYIVVPHRFRGNSYLAAATPPPYVPQEMSEL